MFTVHVRVNDAATGKPTPVRLALLDAAGAYHAPFGRLSEFATAPGVAVGGSVRVGQRRYAHIDGACEVRLPPGPIHIEIHKGPEYHLLRREIGLSPGQISLRLAVQRWTDWRAAGWLPGDVRCHELSPHAALLEGEAEDLAFVNLLANEHPQHESKPGSYSNLLAFSGMKPALTTPGCAVVVNTLNTHPVLGTVSLLNCHRAVFPLRSGAPAEDDWSVADWCDQCHRKKGLVVWPDLPRLTAEQPQGEALAAMVLGKIDAWEVTHFDDPEPAVLADWYRLLDCGFRITLVAASGKDSNARVLGSVRTYAWLRPEDPPDYAIWVEAIRAGRTFVTNGPLLSLSVEDQGPGAVLTGTDRPLRIRADAQSGVPFDQIEVLAGSEVRAAKSTSGDRLRASVETELPVTGPTWIAARCWGRDRLLDGQCAFAHTSPVYVAFENQRLRPDAATIAPLLGVLKQTEQWVVGSARCPSDRHREHLREVLHSARDELLRRQGA
jgi:hypothetical protein